MSKYPIELIEKDFVCNNLGYKEIEKKYKIQQSLIAYYSKRLKWWEKRKEYKRKIVEKSINLQAKSEAKEEFNLIQALENLLHLKINAETKVFFESQSESNKKTIMHYINKSKDGNTELVKVIELLKGNSTENIKFTDEGERETRKDRLMEMAAKVKDVEDIGRG